MSPAEYAQDMFKAMPVTARPSECKEACRVAAKRLMDLALTSQIILLINFYRLVQEEVENIEL